MADLLLVDNDTRITDLTAWFLRRSGHEVRIAASYAEARVPLAERAPDLLLADLELGEESGIEELPRLFAEGLLPPTLVVSGFLDADLAEELARIPGVLGTVSKPFDMGDLEREIARLLETPVEIPRPEAALEVQPETEDEDDGWVEVVPFAEGEA